MYSRLETPPLPTYIDFLETAKYECFGAKDKFINMLKTLPSKSLEEAISTLKYTLENPREELPEIHTDFNVGNYPLSGSYLVSRYLKDLEKILTRGPVRKGMYFFQEEKPEAPYPYIKIGFSENIRDRLKSVRTDVPFKVMVPKAVILGFSQTAEQAFHKLEELEPFKRNGEWYYGAEGFHEALQKIKEYGISFTALNQIPISKLDFTFRQKGDPWH